MKKISAGNFSAALS